MLEQFLIRKRVSFVSIKIERTQCIVNFKILVGFDENVGILHDWLYSRQLPTAWEVGCPVGRRPALCGCYWTWWGSSWLGWSMVLCWSGSGAWCLGWWTPLGAERPCNESCVVFALCFCIQISHNLNRLLLCNWGVSVFYFQINNTIYKDKWNPESNICVGLGFKSFEMKKQKQNQIKASFFQLVADMWCPRSCNGFCQSYKRFGLAHMRETAFGIQVLDPKDLMLTLSTLQKGVQMLKMPFFNHKKKKKYKCQVVWQGIARARPAARDHPIASALGIGTWGQGLAKDRHRWPSSVWPRAGRAVGAAPWMSLEQRPMAWRGWNRAGMGPWAAGRWGRAVGGQGCSCPLRYCHCKNL